MRRRNRSVFGSLSIVALSIAGATIVADHSIGSPPLDVDKIISGTLSQDCQLRYEATNSFIKNVDQARLPRVREEIERKSPQAAAYLVDAFLFVEASQRASVTSEALVKEGIAGATKGIPDTMENQPKIAGALTSILLRKMETETLPTQAFLVGYLTEQAFHYSSEKEAMPFKSAVRALIGGRDQHLRILAAASVAIREGVLGPQERRALIPILLEGLDSHEFALRFYSQHALTELTRQKICFNPLDSPAARSRGKADWQKWYQQRSRRG